MTNSLTITIVYTEKNNKEWPTKIWFLLNDKTKFYVRIFPMPIILQNFFYELFSSMKTPPVIWVKKSVLDGIQDNIEKKMFPPIWQPYLSNTPTSPKQRISTEPIHILLVKATYPQNILISLTMIWLVLWKIRDIIVLAGLLQHPVHWNQHYLRQQTKKKVL